MAQSYLNMPILPHYTLCNLEGEPEDRYFRQIGRDGGEHCRVALADLTAMVTTERGYLVKSARVKNRIRCDELMEKLGTAPPPRLPADRIHRVDARVEEKVRNERLAGETFNDTLRRLLGLT
jgi:hypothetical protein